MQPHHWAILASWIVVLIALVVWLLWMLNSLVDDLIEIRLRKRFLVDLRGALKATQPQWTQVLDIGQSRGVGQRSVFVAVRALLRDVLTGSEPTLLQHRAVLESYLESYRKAEPFEGLPSETRVHLERLQEVLGSGSLALEPLTIQIREMASVHTRDYVRQRIYTVWGFIIGIVGLLFAGYAYFFPYVPLPASASSQPSTSASTATP